MTAVCPKCFWNCGCNSDLALLQVPIKIGTRVMATTGIKAMEIMAIMVTIIKDMEDMVAMIILVTTIIMDMVTTMVSKSINKIP